MKKCELCRLPARLHCESDEANLCAGCDLKVHGANFLVARHSRRLLCRRCQRPTPWEASGARLGATVTVCVQCAAEDEIVSSGVTDEEAAFDDEISDSDFSEDNEEGEGENHVTASFPSAASSSIGDDTSSSCCASRTLKRSTREYDDVDDTDRSLRLQKNRSRVRQQLSRNSM